ncbi:MAG: SAM-dependent DNA methyltransferase, partial [Opitutae bacterium]|nr:SAM-dependent DNA methyltransferase [Opitutae bacterium]
MVVSQTLLHTHGAGDGFRRFRLGPDGCPLCVLRVDDLSRLRPFPEAVSCTATLLLEKGRPTEYPVPYVRWLPGEEHGRRGGPNSPRIEHLAEPIDATRPGSPWLVRPRNLHGPLGELVGPSDYTARLGANSAGANGVYWVEVLGPAEGGVRIRNLAEAGRREVELVECVVEPDLLFPLLRWGDLARYRARPAAHVLVPQDFETRTGLPEDVLKAGYPKTFAYLARFEPLLRRRAAYRRYQEDRPFYSMYNVGPYTAAGVKVAWRRMDTRLTAAVLEPMNHPLLGPRPVIPQETCVLIDCETADEAHYLCALVGSALVGFLVGAHGVAGGKGFGTPGILEFIRLRRFDPGCEIHRQLATASRAAHAWAARESDGGTSGALAEVQREIDAAAAALWGLDSSEQ